ncbi:MAG: XdhC family protein [Rhodobacteraceae bacterium]|nr:XdhC family protein [Paracoccaceae bacterium]
MDKPAFSEPDGDLIEAMAALRREGRAFCVATVVRTVAATSAKAGAKALITAEGALKGHIGGGCVLGAAKRAAVEALENGQPRLIRVKPSEAVSEPVDSDGVPLHKSGCPSGGTVDLFIEPYAPAPLLLILGDGPAARSLARIGGELGYRAALSAPEAAEMEIAARDFVVIVTQGNGDAAALRRAIESPAAYVAMVASKRKARTMVARLTSEGVSPERLGRLRAPAGLDIGAIEPEEIALSILAEIIQCRRREAMTLVKSDV